MAITARGKFGISLRGTKEVKKNFMLRTAMVVPLRTAALRENGRLVKKEMKRLAPPYPLSMLKHGKRWWKPTGELKRSIDFKLVGARGGQDIEIGPMKSMKGYKYFPGDRWLALEYGHSHGYYGERPFVRPALYNNVDQIRKINRKHFSKLAR